MPRSTLVFGNGLGRTLDNDFFQLRTALGDVWEHSENFTREQRELVISALPDTNPDRFPCSEDQLDKLQIALISADFLRSFENNEVRWLTEESRKLPAAFKRYVHEVAAYFHMSGQNLPPAFTRPLVDFIRETTSHVATLNYDNLLYDALTQAGVLRGYYDTLIDGFTMRAGFSPLHLDRHATEEKSWYLHLHGSPLYIGNRKLMGVERGFLSPSDTSHIVLAPVAHKPIIISGSHILTEYWNRLATALGESQKAILVGYSGTDSHLNKVINDRLPSREIAILERLSNETLESRQRHWHRQFPQARITIHRAESLFHFNDWNAL
ncbi:SIR2 family protein [Marinobacter salarius]|uniref:SIR2 family protein n=1 Tax=Marinobacter salarius TaxID=1420917 RepID=UPI00273AE81B|nr:SIR2 family protein [Marinobacter salarius]MDP4532519.1 SIR2 family protein [Marinobacter salarius]